MIYKGKEIDFPAVIHFSLYKVIESLEGLAKDSDSAAALQARELLKEVEKYPELRTGITDLENLGKYQDSINKFSQYLFPDLLLTNEIKALTPPFQFDPLYLSTRFKNIIAAADDDYSLEMKDVDQDTFYMYCCYYIMGTYYQYPIQGGGVLQMEIFNKLQGILRKYKVLVNADLLEFVPTDKAVDITKEDYELLMDNFHNQELWKEKFPPDSWIMKGATLISMVDVTKEESIRSITETLLSPGVDSFGTIQNSIRSLINNTHVDFGVLFFEKGSLRTVDKHEITSILLNDTDALPLTEDVFGSCYQSLWNKQPLIVPDLETFHKKEQCVISKRLLSTKYKSYTIAPFISDDEIIGFVEFASPNRYDLNAATFDLLVEIIPILSMAQRRFVNEAQNQIEAVIQQECTTIHPSVKWKFEEEANAFINAQAREEHPVFKDIIFKDLYPLYGQMDIKASSTKRNEAVAIDLRKQIEEVNVVLKAALKATSMPIYEELIQRLESFYDGLAVEVGAGSEHEILSYMKTQVYPAFSYLIDHEPHLKLLIDHYQSLLDPEMMTIYEARRKYDKNVNLLNQRLSTFLDAQQVKAQQMFPHYFERYKTDGVEYNIYIGQSITKEKKFDLIHLKNLRLWQLMVMCEMENEFVKIRKELASDIEMASLILVHNTALAVHFRMDEKQFDVEGAYNARYEIIKKRVDKALIKGTNERVTQPGHIAIIYSQDQDQAEYKGYLNFLISKGLIEEGIEDVVLEDLQGVTGLRALRVKVVYHGSVTVEQFMQTMEETEM